MLKSEKSQVTPLDAPAGYPERLKLFSGQEERCAVYPMNDFGGPVRYAFIKNPKSMAVRYSCFKVKEPKPLNQVSGYKMVQTDSGLDYAQYFAYTPKAKESTVKKGLV